MTAKKMISLKGFNDQINPVSYLWICGVGCPAGKSFDHDTHSEGEDYCDLGELISEMGFWELEGVIEGTIQGRQWQWNGVGDVRDANGNTIYNIAAH